MPDPQQQRQLTLNFGDDESKCCEHEHCPERPSEQVRIEQAHQDACGDLQEEDK